MAPYEYDDVLVPMLAQLVKRLRITPSEKELDYLKTKKDVKELTMFFDAAATGATDREIYDKIMEPIYAEEKAAREAAEKAERERLEAERKAKEEEEKAAAKLAAEKKEAEEKAKAEAEARAAQEKYDAEMAKKCPGKCAHCGKWIEEKDYLESDGTYLHTACLDDYQNATAPKCDQCWKPITGEYVTVKSAVTKQEVTLHPDCTDAYKKATRPNCKKCGEQILDAAMAQLGPNDFFHSGCVPAGPPA